MLNKEDILALAWEHSGGSGKRYTFTEESLFEFLNELKKDQATSQDEQQPVLAVMVEDDCVEHFHPEYGGGYFFTEDAIVEMYAAPIAQTAWTSVEDRLPDPEQHDRVLIFTDGYDFAGEQYFDVKAESLNEHSFGDPDDQPEPYCKATHWMPLPDATALSLQAANKI